MYISDEAVLQIERARSQAVNYLKNLGYEIDSNANWVDINKFLSKLQTNYIARRLLEGTLSGELNDDSITYLKNYALTGCASIRSVKFDNLKHLCARSLEGPSYNKPIVVEAAEIENYAFTGISARIPIILKKFTIRPGMSNEYYQSSSISIIDAQKTGVSNPFPIASSAMFSGSTNISAIIDRNEVLTPITSANVFNTSMKNNVTLYVPESRVEETKNATNYASNFANVNEQIKAIEGSEYENLEWYKDWIL